MGETSAVTEPDAGARQSRAIAFFGTWMLIGLFLDGWAHSTAKPETFFSPWHGILYSGFVAAVGWYVWDGRRNRTAPVTDRYATAGLVLFVAGALGDGVWHTLFGIEVDIEALLSPTHLALMVGGALMVSAPLRHAWEWLPERPTMRQFAPALASITLVTSLALFFLMYLSAAAPIAAEPGEQNQGWGIASVIVRTVVMLGAALFLLIRWTPPAGSFTVLFTVPAVALSGIEGFQAIALVTPFVLGGIVADVIVARSDASRRAKTIGLVVPTVSWITYFAVHAVVWGVRWPAEIWTGAVVFAGLAGTCLALLTDGLNRPVRQVVTLDARAPRSASTPAPRQPAPTR